MRYRKRHGICLLVQHIQRHQFQFHFFIIYHCGSEPAWVPNQWLLFSNKLCAVRYFIPLRPDSVYTNLLEVRLWRCDEPSGTFKNCATQLGGRNLIYHLL